MSETVYFKGVLKVVEKMEGETLEAQCKRLLGVDELPSHFESYEEYLMDEHYQEYVIRNEVVYQVEKNEVDPDSDFFRAHVNKDGDIEFDVRYYNGGCSFDEAIHEALGTIEPKVAKRVQENPEIAKRVQENPEKRYRYFVSFSTSRGGVGRCTLERNSLITGISHIEDIEKLLSEQHDGEKFFVSNYQLMDTFDVEPVKEKEYEVKIHAFNQYTF